MVESVYFTSLEIENVRCFGNRQELDLTVDGRRPARWTLILGDNGVGKTTLLECLTWMRLEPSGFDPALFDKYNDYLERLLPVGRSGDLSLSAEISVGSGLSMIDDVPKSLSRRRLVKANLTILVNSKRKLTDRKFSRSPKTYVNPWKIVC